MKSDAMAAIKSVCPFRSYICTALLCIQEVPWLRAMSGMG